MFTNSNSKVDVVKFFGNKALVEVREGGVFYVNHLFPRHIHSLMEVLRIDRASVKLTARIDCLLLVEGLHSSKKGCKHIRFARISRGHAKEVEILPLTSYPKARVALGSVPQYHAPGGFAGNVIGYPDEQVVPDFGSSGARGWVLPKSDIKKAVKALPPLVSNGKVMVFWVESVGFASTPDEFSVNWFSSDPTENEPLEYKNRPAGWYESFNRLIFQIYWDAGSRKITKILCSEGEEGDSNVVCWEKSPENRYIRVGDTVPKVLREVSREVVQAHMLYMWRELIAGISGSDLHEVFEELLGESSPSGYEELCWEAIPEFIRQSLEKSVREILPELTHLISNGYVFSDPVKLLNDIRLEYFPDDENLITEKDIEPLMKLSFRQALPKINSLLGFSSFNWL